jgi:SPP1 gp7 family putative phage head morphogenesis protein
MTEYDIEELQRHYLYLERLASGAINSVIEPSLKDTTDAVMAILGQYDKITTKAQYNQVAAAIKQAVEQNSGWATFTEEQLQELADYESEWQAGYAGAMMNNELTAPTGAALYNSIANATLILESASRVDTGLWSDFIRSNTESHYNQINNIVQRGFIRGETVSVMRKKIRETSEGMIRREADTLARTGFNHYASQANEVMIEANADVLQEYYYIVTFDSRTSDRCIGVSKLNKKGNRLKVGDSKAPQPPLHFNCRTRRMAVPGDFEPEGTKAAVGGQEGKQAEEKFQERDKRRRTASQVRYRGRKDKDIFKPGQVDASLTYDQWLRKQPRWFINDTLGPRRAKLWLEDGVALTKFSDMLGNPLTIEEIKKREGKA